MIRAMFSTVGVFCPFSHDDIVTRETRTRQAGRNSRTSPLTSPNALHHYSRRVAVLLTKMYDMILSTCKKQERPCR